MDLTTAVPKAALPLPHQPHSGFHTIRASQTCSIIRQLYSIAPIIAHDAYIMHIICRANRGVAGWGGLLCRLGSKVPLHHLGHQPEEDFEVHVLVMLRGAELWCCAWGARIEKRDGLRGVDGREVSLSLGKMADELLWA